MAFSLAFDAVSTIHVHGCPKPTDHADHSLRDPGLNGNLYTFESHISALALLLASPATVILI
jgi:hypothetical protein